MFTVHILRTQNQNTGDMNRTSKQN